MEKLRPKKPNVSVWRHLLVSYCYLWDDKVGHAHQNQTNILETFHYYLSWDYSLVYDVGETVSSLLCWFYYGFLLWFECSSYRVMCPVQHGFVMIQNLGIQVGGVHRCLHKWEFQWVVSTISFFCSYLVLQLCTQTKVPYPHILLYYYIHMHTLVL